MTENNAAQAAEQEMDAIMEQAQVFASAWAFLGGPFDNGSGLEQAERERSNLRTMLSKLRSEGVQAGDERKAFERAERHRPGYGDDTLTRAGTYEPSDEYLLPLVQARWVGWQTRAAEIAVPVSAQIGFVDPLYVAGRLRGMKWNAKIFNEPTGEATAPLYAALASAPVAGKAIQKAKHDTCHAETERERVTALAYWLDQQTFEPGMLSIAAATLRAMLPRDAAPQASEAVRNAALEEAASMCESWMMDRPRVSAEAVANQTMARMARYIRALKTQADKDGGDCAQGAGDVS